MRSEVWINRCVAVVIIIVTSGLLAIQADSQDDTGLPTLSNLSEKAALREQAFDDIDAVLKWEIFNPDRDLPVFRISCRSVKHGNKLLIDIEKRNLLNPDHQNKVLMSFDGQVARSVFPLSMKGKVSRDWQRDVVRGHFYGPDILGITLIEASGETVGSLLRGAPKLSPGLIRIPRSVKVLGKENIDGESCVAVEVVTGEAPYVKTVLRLYFAEDYGYSVLQADHGFLRDGRFELGSRQKMCKFEEIKKDLWYPMEGRYEVYQGKPNVLQTTVYSIETVSWPRQFDESLFALEFPAGTHVFDTIAGIDYIAGGGDILEGHEVSNLAKGDLNIEENSQGHPGPLAVRTGNEPESRFPSTANRGSARGSPGGERGPERSYFLWIIVTFALVAIGIVAVVLFGRLRKNRQRAA